jgi:GWxTD domain-containing protein
MKIKITILGMFWLLICLDILAVEQLGIFVDVKRYLDGKLNTKYVIDYQVPYKNLTFLARGRVFFAELNVNYTILKADSVVINDEFTQNIGVTKKNDITTEKSFLDRISLTLAKPGYNLYIKFRDLNSTKSYDWIYETKPLDPECKLSDLELIDHVVADTTILSQKFKRNGASWLPAVSAIVSKGLIDSMYFFCEQYDIDHEYNIATLNIEIGSTIVLISSLSLPLNSSSNQLVFPVNTTGFEAGKYVASVELKGIDKIYKRYLEFFVKENTLPVYFALSDVDDEFQLMRYIAPIKSFVNWKSMSKEAKIGYISNFWISIAESQNQPVETVIANFKKRIDFCNARFSHFEKGWKSDMGRIYIRNGAPDDIDTDASTDDIKFIRKDIQIWKYSGNSHAVYMFVDIPMNGNYKLVYASNDEQESSNPNWRKYLGSDFDESRLEN